MIELISMIGLIFSIGMYLFIGYVVGWPYIMFMAIMIAMSMRSSDATDSKEYYKFVMEGRLFQYFFYCVVSYSQMLTEYVPYWLHEMIWFFSISSFIMFLFGRLTMIFYENDIKTWKENFESMKKLNDETFN